MVLKEDYSSKYSHAESLHVFIDEVLTEAGIKTSDLNAVAVSKGPGSYTGLRIGVSAAKGLCFALNIPLIAIDTLTALAKQVVVDNGFIVPMLDARRMEVYMSLFDNSYHPLKPITAQILDGHSFEDVLNKGQVYFIGSGVEKTQALISHSNAIFIEDKLPSAKEMGALAYSKYQNSDFEDVAYFEPFYLKDFMGNKKT